MTRFAWLGVSCALLLLATASFAACGDDPALPPANTPEGDGDEGDGDEGDGDEGDGDEDEGDGDGDGDEGDGDDDEGDGDAPAGDGDDEGDGDGDGDAPADAGVDKADAGSDKGDAGPTAPGVCGGSTPHGCYKPKAGNPAGCGPQIFEQSAYYPPLEEWKGCGTVMAYETCNYESPDGKAANCVCDTGLHWLCTYP